MLFSIRVRMFLIVLSLMVPMCVFAWFLMQEVNKQVEFAQKELKGVEMQKPLLQLLAQLHDHRFLLQAGLDAEAKHDELAKSRLVVKEKFKKLGADIGFGDQVLSDADKEKIRLPVANGLWSGVHGALDKAVADLPHEMSEEALKAHDEAIAATQAMLQRAADGSNLTLDPDLDSYYLMDVASFAVPNAMHFLGKARSEMTSILPHRRADRETPLNPEHYATAELYDYIIQEDNMVRIANGVSTSLSEDKNFYGESPTLPRLQALLADYTNANKMLVDIFEKFHTQGVTIGVEELAQSFENTEHDLLALGAAAQDELESLLTARIAAMESHLEGLVLEGVAAIVGSLLLFLLISHSIVSPINKLRRIMLGLANGDTSAAIPYTKKRDEIGQMAGALVVFKQNAEQMQKMAKDFDQSVKHVVEIVASAATEMDSTSKELSQHSQSNSEKLVSMNEDVQFVAQSMQTVATAGEQLYSAINEISAQVQKSSQTTTEAVQQASHVQKTAEQLAEAAKRVSGIVTLIESIAAKINLLSLNATIEAARAGDAGKGFAVVASEVKNLASQTTNATAEISKLIEAIQSSSNDTLGAIGHITGTVTQMGHISSAIASAVEEQGAATKEIAEHIKSASGLVSKTQQNMGMITASSANSSAAAAQALQASGELSRQTEILRGDVDRFLKKLVAA